MRQPPRITPGGGGQANINVGLNANGVQAGITALQNQFQRLQGSISRNFQSMTSSMNRSFSSLTAPIREIEGALVSLFSVRAAVGLAKSIYDMNSQFMAVKNTLLAVTGTQEGVRQEMDFLHQTADRLGVDFLGITEQYGKLRIAGQEAGIATDKVKEVFVGLSEASRVLHLSNQDTVRSMVAIMQIMSKGKVQAEEITRQLSNAIPGGAAIAAKALGMTTIQMNENLKKGTLTAKMLMENFAGALHEIYGQSVPAAINTSVAEFGRLKTAMQFITAEYGAELEPVFKEIAMLGENLLKTFTNFVSPQEFSMLVRKLLAGAAESIADFIDLVEANPFVVEGGLIGFFLFGGRGGIIRRVVAGGVGGLLGSLYNSLFGDGLYEQWHRATSAVDTYQASLDKAIASQKEMQEWLDASKKINETRFESKDSFTEFLDKLSFMGSGSDAEVSGFTDSLKKADEEVASLKKELTGAQTEADMLWQKLQGQEIQQTTMGAAADNLRNFAAKIRSVKEEVATVPDKDYLVIFPDDFPEQMRTWRDSVREIIGTKQALRGFQDDITTGFVEMANGSKNAFADMVQSIIRQIERLIVQYYIAAPIINAIGSMLGIQPGATNPNGTPQKGGLDPDRGAGGGTPLPTPAPHDTGGYIPRGRMGTVAERGSELVDGSLVMGPANVVSRKDTAKMMGGTTKVVTNVNVKTMAGSTAEVEQRDNGNGGMDIEVVIKKIENSLANRYSRQQGALHKAMRNQPFK